MRAGGSPGGAPFVRSIVRGAFQARKRARLRLRRWAKLARSSAQRAVNQLRYLNVFYSPPGEVRACPACRSGALRHLDVTWQRLGNGPRHAGFVTGCAACGLVFVNPPPRAEDLAAYYAPDSAYVEERWHRPGAVHVGGRTIGATRTLGREERDKMRRLFAPVASCLDVLHPPAGAKVLDYGCGPGRWLNRLQALGWETYGIEPAVKSAFSRHRELAEPPAEPTFRLVILHHVLEHLKNPLDALRSLSNAMLEGGVMYISVPRLDALPVHGDLYYCINPNGHFVAYTRDCLTVLLGMAGLSVVDAPDDGALDRMLTGGEPRRLRLFARKAAGNGGIASAPLRAAEDALRGYRARFGGRRRRFDGLVPVRLRASWLERARQQTVLAHRRLRIGRD